MKCGSTLRAFATVSLTAVMILDVVSNGAQAQSRPPTGGERLARPQAAPLRVAEVPPALQRILENWSQAGTNIHKLEGKHRRWVYDSVFQVEKRSEGIFYYEAPDKGRIDIESAKISPKEQSQKTGIGGKPYTLQGDQSQRWICNGTEIIQVNDADKTLEMYPIPPQDRGKNIINGPLPFLFGLPPDQAKMRYNLTLKSDNEKEAWIIAKPRWKQDSANWREATIILDKKTWLPRAVKLLDPPGTSETVFLFYDFEINKKRGPFDGIFGKDPFQPDLKGYRLVVNQAGAGKPGSEKPQEEKKTSGLLPRLPLRR